MQATLPRLFPPELNEVNFDFVSRYSAQGKLLNLARLISDHGIIETTSEHKYEELEPWIQWVTAHTGKAYFEHGVFRLGDIVDHEIDRVGGPFTAVEPRMSSLPVRIAEAFDVRWPAMVS